MFWPRLHVPIITLTHTHTHLTYSHSSASDSQDGTELEQNHYKPVVCTGRQPDSEVYVVDPKLHFTSAGVQISEEDQKYIWITAVFKKLHMEKVLPVCPLMTLPVVENPLNNLLAGMASITGENFLSGVFVIGTPD